MQTKNALISVIVPIYKIEKYIGICIESLINQTYKNIEIILVDDGSPDRCPEICDLYAKKDKRIKVIHKENGGLVSARKAGLLASNGEYIGYVDGDDWVGAGFYETLYTAIVTSEADIACAGQSRDLFERSVHFTNSLPSGIYEGTKLEELCRNMISNGEFYRPGVTTYVWNKLFKREILMEAQLNVDDRISIGEDGAVTYPALLASKRVCITDNCAYHYRQREDSMLKKSESFANEAQKLKYLYDYLIAWANKHNNEYDLIKQITDYVLSICIIRSGGILDETATEPEFTPYGSKIDGKKIVVYSAGTFGQQLMNRFLENSRCDVVGWVDDDYWEYRRCCMDVDPVESITKHEYDYVLIATVDRILAKNISNRLLDYGLSKDKILIVSCEESIREKLLERYLNCN